MCNLGVMPAKTPAQDVNRGVNMASLDMSVTKHHRQRLVAAYALDRWKIDACLDQTGDRGVAHCIGRDSSRTEFRSHNRSGERASHVGAMPRLGPLLTHGVREEMRQCRKLTIDRSLAGPLLAPVRDKASNDFCGYALQIAPSRFGGNWWSPMAPRLRSDSLRAAIRLRIIGRSRYGTLERAQVNVRFRPKADIMDILMRPRRICQMHRFAEGMFGVAGHCRRQP